MTLPFVVDDAKPIPGARAICFPGGDSSKPNCRTLGYECTVVGQVQTRRPRQLEKSYLVYVNCFHAPFIAREGELFFCTPCDVPPIVPQGELVVAWEAPDEEVVGAYRINKWVPFAVFQFRKSNVPEPMHRFCKAEDDCDVLLYKMPMHAPLNADVVIAEIGKITHQRQWRLLPQLPP